MKDVSFDNLASAFSSLATSIGNGQNGIAHALGEAIRDRAKEKIGEYQSSSHGFDAWAPLAQSTMDQRVSKGFPANNPLLRSGELRDSITMRSDGNGVIIGSPLDIALYQENGTEHIPPRPFLGPAAGEVMDSAPELIVKVISSKLR